jgi:hypothetical protein
LALLGVLTVFAGEVNTGVIPMKARSLRGVVVGSSADLERHWPRASVR